MLLDLIFPKLCYGCRRPGRYFCSGCFSKIPVLPVKTSSYPQLQAVLSLYPYRLMIKEALIDLKYNFVSDMVPELGSLAVATISRDYPHLLRYWLDQHFYLAPIPLHYFRHNWRGFNQSQLLASFLSVSLGLHIIPNLLVRCRSTLPQAHLKKSFRRKNVSSAFVINRRCLPPPGQKYLLFDDVITTGSTLMAAVDALETLQPSEIWGLSIAGSRGHRI